MKATIAKITLRMVPPRKPPGVGEHSDMAKESRRGHRVHLLTGLLVALAIVLLIERDVFQPLGIKRGGVVIERSRSRKDLRVAGPTQALVALRAVRGNVEKVSFLSPNNVVLQLVQPRIGTFKPPRARNGTRANLKR